MRARVLLAHLWRSHRVPLLPLAAGAALFEWVMTRVAPDPSQTGLVRGLLQLAPPPLLRIFSEELAANITARGFLGFGYAHPFILLAMSVWVVRVASGALAGEIGRGTMDLIAARPVARAAQLAAVLVGLLGGLTLIAGAAWAGTAIGLAGRPLEGVAAFAYLPVAAGCSMLFASFGTVGIAISASRRDGGSAIAWTAGVVAVSFVLDYLARVWDDVASLRPLSLFSYYQPQRILREGLVAADAFVLAGVSVLALVTAFVVFSRRNL